LDSKSIHLREDFQFNFCENRFYKFYIYTHMYI
jgi:hypothetical protein